MAGTSVYALLVGINQYLSPNVPDLDGCVNDVLAVKRYLQDKWQVPETNIHCLLDEQATHRKIADEFRQHLILRAREWYEARAVEPAPVFLFHFSGHGSQAFDVDDDEDDKWDETLVPHDSRTGEVYDIIDDEIGSWLAELIQYTRHVTVILDCCHSGTATRGDPPPAVRRCVRDFRPQPMTTFKRSVPFSAQPAKEILNGWDLPIGSYLAISGCTDEQESFEIEIPVDGTIKSFGALTHSLIQVLETFPSEMSPTYREVFDKVHQLVNQHNSKQTPVIQGDLDRRWFS